MAAESFDSVGDFGRHPIVVLHHLFRRDAEAGGEEIIRFRAESSGSAASYSRFSSRSERRA